MKAEKYCGDADQRSCSMDGDRKEQLAARIQSGADSVTAIYAHFAGDESV